MKINKLLGAVVTVAATLLMTATAFAATTFTVGEAELVEGEVIVPIKYESTEYQYVSGFQFNLGYDNTKYAYSYFDDNIIGQYKKGSKMVDAPRFETWDSDKGDSVLFAGSLNTNNFPEYTAVDTSKAEDGVLLYVAFTQTSGELAPNDFYISNVSALYVNTSETDTSDASAAQQSSGTFVTLSVPKEVGDDWEFGYIYSLKAVVKDGDTVLGEEDLTECVENGSNYDFVAVLKPQSAASAAKVVDVEFVAQTAATKDATEYTEKVIKKETGLRTYMVVE
ncbi:MAG: hypothetical protein IKS17_00260 [Firmicutes bacterium]|nr:hypothetical protein [Bacillota bacterium]